MTGQRLQRMQRKNEGWNVEEVRLNKYLASCGVCSRRDADKLIEAGEVCVNGVKAQAGQRVTGQEQITVRGKVLQGQEEKVVLAYYKPPGVVCTERDPHAARLVTKEVKYDRRITYAGRLDRDSEGLLLLTNDGVLIDAMMRGRNAHEKEYIVKSDKPWTDVAIDRLRAGVYLAELAQTTRPCEIEKIGEKTLKIILTQGLNRQIRRMCQMVGYQIRSLKRTRVINITLGDLKQGEYRELTAEETEALYRSCGLTAP